MCLAVQTTIFPLTLKKANISANIMTRNTIKWIKTYLLSIQYAVKSLLLTQPTVSISFSIFNILNIWSLQNSFLCVFTTEMNNSYIDYQSLTKFCLFRHKSSLGPLARTSLHVLIRVFALYLMSLQQHI